MSKSTRMETAQKPLEKEKNEPDKKEMPEGKLPIWTFALQGRSVRAKSLQEAKEKIKIKR